MRIDYKNHKLIDPEKIDQKEIEFAVRETNLDIDSALLDAEKQLNAAKEELEIIESTYPLDLQRGYDLTEDVRMLSKMYTYLNNLKEKFGF